MASIEKQKKGVILMYRFTYTPTPNENSIDFTFVKLEAHKQFSVAHIKGARKRYYTGEKRQARQVRREDSFKDCKYIKTGVCEYKIKTLCNHDSPTGRCQIHCNQKLNDYNPCQNESIKSDMTFYDKKIRLGSEYYIPQTYTNRLLSDFSNCRQ